MPDPEPRAPLPLAPRIEHVGGTDIDALADVLVMLLERRDKRLGRQNPREVETPDPDVTNSAG